MSCNVACSRDRGRKRRLWPGQRSEKEAMAGAEVRNGGYGQGTGRKWRLWLGHRPDIPAVVQAVVGYKLRKR